MIVTPNIHFNGQCEEAIALYKEAFDARVDFVLHYSELAKEDGDYPLSEEQKKSYVCHAEVYLGEQRIMMADSPEPDLKRNESFFLCITFDTADEVKKAYAVLKEGAKVLLPMRSTTYSSCEVSFVDRFGVRWGLMTEQTER